MASPAAIPRAPHVSILAAYHNRADAVRGTFESLINQTLEDIEILAWDDHSSDDTWGEMQRVAAELDDPRLHIYRTKTNLGFYPGLNDAIARSKGEFIAICGSGDLNAPDRIAAQIKALEGDPAAAFCASASTTIDPSTGKSFVDERFDSPRIHYDDIVDVVPFTHGTVMYRRSVLDEVGLYEGSFIWCADWDLFFRILKNRHGVYISDKLYTRFARDDGASFNPEKSFSQIKHQQLAKSLARLGASGRSQCLSTLHGEGLDRALEIFGGDYSRSMYRRKIKLVLMGRVAEARKLSELMSTLPRRSRVYEGLYLLASGMRFLPVSSDRLIDIARKSRGAVRLLMDRVRPG